MKNIFLIICILFLGLSSYAKDYSVHKLENGQTVIIEEVHDNPIVIIDTWVKTGSINEDDTNNGVAHFLEHLFFKGTEKHPLNEFDKLLESKGAETNAATSKDYTHFYILIPSKEFELAMDLHSDMLLNPSIPRKELEKERKVVLEEIAKNNDEPSRILYKNLIQSFYINHPYKREVIGTKEIIENITKDEIMDFYNKWYIPSNMITVIVGDVNTEKALELVKKDFITQKPTNKITKIKNKQDKKPSIQTEKKVYSDILTGYLLIGYKGAPSLKSKDSYALDVLSTIIGDGKSSRLYKSLKEQKQLVSSISSANSPFKEDSIFFINANFTQTDIERIKESIFSEINLLKKNEVTSDELQKAKNIIERDTFYSRESVSNIANEIGYTVVMADNTSFYQNYLDNIKKVTVQDVKRVANTYLDENNAVISFVLPKDFENISTPQKEIKNHSAKLVKKSKNIEKYLLENDATLIINNNDLNDIIAINILVKGGNNTEKIPGTASVLASAMMKGTEKYKSQELAEILEQNGIKLNLNSSTDNFSVTLKYTKNEKQLALGILEEILNHPSLDTLEIEKIKADKMFAVKNIKNTPSSFAIDEFKTGMWQGTPNGNTGHILEKTIPTIQKENIEEYYKNLFNAQNIIISVNGNIDKQEYINYFSSLFQKTSSPAIDIKNFKNKYSDLTKNKIIKNNKDTQSTWIILGWKTDGILNKKDWATLKIIDSILGSGMSSRLFNDLRDGQGLAYQIGSSFSANVNNGNFITYIGTNENTAIKSRDEILNQIDKLKKEFVLDKELYEAKEQLIGKFVLSMETNMDKATTVAFTEATGLGIDFINEYPELIKSVTVQDIITTANKYFNKPYVLSVVGTKKVIEKF